MAAYAALLSLMHIIHNIERHPSPPISLHKDQVESLTQKVNSLQKFLDGYHSPFDYSDEADPLEVRIADAANAAEDVIETEIVDRIHSRSSILEKVDNFSKLSIAYECAGTTTRDDFNEDLQKIIEETELIKKDVTEKAGVEPQFNGNVSADDAGERSSHEMVGCDDVGERKSHEMVGCDEVLLQLLDRLTGGESSHQIIPVVGMGGIGKTTLAKTVFGHPLIKEHFDVCLWATISLDYNVKATFDEVLSQVSGKSRDKSEEELGLELHKYLCGRRYLVVMDDLWSLEVWDKMKIYFPEFNNGSRILVTTRMSNLAVHLTNSNNLLSLKFLDEGSAWDLFSKIVFGEESFPIELKRIGRGIVERCKGLPLSIVVIGGLLAKSQHTPQYWHEIETNLSSVNDECCLSTLKTSYNHLPAYLKPCFLYMGTFEEDNAIRVSKLIRLWVCEGFLRPRSDKSPETIAEEYLMELVDRNLVLVDKLGVLGDIKYCKMHDLVRDLSLKEAKKQRFYHIISKYSPGEVSSSHRRIVVRRWFKWKLIANNYMPHARSYTCNNIEFSCSSSSRLLRTLNIENNYSQVDLLQFVNARYVNARVRVKVNNRISISQLWNLHTLIITSRLDCIIAPMEIWKMPQLRHVEFKCKLEIPNPPSSKDDDDIVVMENLHTLKGVSNLELNEEVVKRIPNIKKLKLHFNFSSLRYEDRESRGVNGISYPHCLENLYLNSFNLRAEAYLQKITRFPRSLKKLTMNVSFDCELDDMLQKIGSSLPNLQKLSLRWGVFGRRKWETSEGQFPSLMFLSLFQCRDLENWTVSESSPFPCLQELRLVGFDSRTLEIPSEIGEIATVKCIVVHGCSESVVQSAKKIADEQENLCGDLHVTAIVNSKEQEEALQSLSGPNFKVKVYSE